MALAEPVANLWKFETNMMHLTISKTLVEVLPRRGHDQFPYSVTVFHVEAFLLEEVIP